MSGRTARRVLARSAAAAGAALVAIVGMVLLSGTGQPVTAKPFPRWQELAPPPLSPRTNALAVQVGPRVLVLGGNRPAHPALRDGASYNLQTGMWQRVRTPVALRSDDDAVAAAGVVVVRHRAVGGATSWWTLDPTPGTWRRLRHVPRDAGSPSAFGSEVYAVAERQVVVYSAALDRWTPLPTDRVRPRLIGRHVVASRAGVVVTGRAGHSLVADRWDGLRWRRTHVVPPTRRALPPRLPTSVRGVVAVEVKAGGRWLAVVADEAWLRSP